MGKSGFTLIELLVAIAIIGILSSLTFASFSSSQKRGRDGQRKFDMRSVQSALEQYYSQQNPQTYPNSGTTPAATDFNSLVSASGPLHSFLKIAPSDPITTQAYFYSPQTCNANVCVSYYLCAKLENFSDPDIQNGTGKYICPDSTYTTGSHPGNVGWYGLSP